MENLALDGVSEHSRGRSEGRTRNTRKATTLKSFTWREFTRKTDSVQLDVCRSQPANTAHFGRDRRSLVWLIGWGLVCSQGELH